MSTVESAAANKLLLPLERARAVLLFLGFQLAPKWNADQMTKKMPLCGDIDFSAGPKDEQVKIDLAEVLEAVKASREIRVFEGDQPTEADLAKKSGDDKAQKEVERASKAKARQEAAEEKKAAREKAKAEKEQAKANKAAGKGNKAAGKGNKAAGKGKPAKDMTKGRGYYAGVVCRTMGYKDGITETMIAEVDRLYGKANPQVSKGALGWAISALEGFNAGAGAPSDPSA